MNTYLILRRSGWRSPEDLQAAAARSTKVGEEEMSDDIRRIRSYVLEEDSARPLQVRRPCCALVHQPPGGPRPPRLPDLQVTRTPS
jgi:hypothetical protein